MKQGLVAFDQPHDELSGKNAFKFVIRGRFIFVQPTDLHRPCSAVSVPNRSRIKYVVRSGRILLL